MGASSWDYLTLYRGTPQETLRALQEEVFTADGWAEEYESIEDLWADEEFMGEQGTHSVLDVHRVTFTDRAPDWRWVDDYHTVRPLPRDRLLHHFGTVRPTVGQYTRAVAGRDLQDEADMRWTGRFVLLHTGGEPTHLGVFGYSGD